MDLGKAIKQAIRFCSKDGTTTERSIRLVPRESTGLGRPALFVHNKDFGLRIQVDQELPNALVEASVLEPMCKDLKHGVTVSDIEERGFGKLQFSLSGTNFRGVHFVFESLPPSEWIGFDVHIPDSFEKNPYWPFVASVLHAAHKDIEFLSTVKFTSDYVEATDKSRLARAHVPWAWEGILPVSMFRNMTKSPTVATRFTDKAAFFLIDGDELRFHTYVNPSNYPDCSKLIPETHSGPYATVSTEALSKLMKTATAASPTHWVSLDIGDGQLTGRAFHSNNAPPKYEGSVSVNANGPGKLLINGKYVLDALKAVTTPRVRLCYDSPTDPLLLESGYHQECIWPLK